VIPVALRGFAMFVGLNLSSNDDWQTCRHFDDLSAVLRPWGTPAKPYEPFPFPLTNGYPQADFAGFAALANQPSGDYRVTWLGSGAVEFVAGVKNVRQTGSREATVEIDGESGNFAFKVTGVQAADPFRALSIRRVGDGAGEFSPEFVALCRRFQVLRFMDWQRTNNSPVARWDDRARAWDQQTTAKGVALEYCLSLAEESGASAWLCVPHGADYDYAAKMAAACKPFGVSVWLEISNEPWNGIFTQRAALLAEAKADKSLDVPPNVPTEEHPTDENARLYRLVAKKLAAAVETFRAAGVDCRGVLAGQAANPWLAEQGLAYLKRVGKIGTVAAVAYADYFVTDTDFPNLDAGAARSAGWHAAYRALADKYAVAAVAAYEAGQHLTGAGSLGLTAGAADAADVYRINRGVETFGRGEVGRSFAQLKADANRPGAAPGDKRAANLSAEMGERYKRAFAAFRDAAGPGAVYCWFAAPASWGDGRFGYWGLSERLGTSTPKLEAALASAGSPVNPPPPPPPPPVDPPAPVRLTMVTLRIGEKVYQYNGPRAPVTVTVSDVDTDCSGS
jgi:hypothetical protein